MVQPLDMNHLDQPSMTCPTGESSQRPVLSSCEAVTRVVFAGSHVLLMLGQCREDGADCVCAAPTDTSSPGMDMTLWEAWYCHDGVTVFFGTSEENEDVIMVSLIVHAPPSLVTEASRCHVPQVSKAVWHWRRTERVGTHDMCSSTPPALGRLGHMMVRGMLLQVLLKNDILRSASNIGLQSTRVLERTDDSTVIFSGRWVPGGWAATLLAPRDVVVKRTWRSVPPTLLHVAPDLSKFIVCGF